MAARMISVGIAEFQKTISSVPYWGKEENGS